jgi:NAD(P)-dependent dehydrogenase (short-subunit alcohol dehydrogenase family)
MDMTQGPLHILLTGAASGLGRGLALHFAGKGPRLVLADCNADGLREPVGMLDADAQRASALIHGHDGEYPCSRRPFADAG